MPVTKVGIVYYTTGPHKGEIFRIVYPEFDDSELDEPPTDGERKPHLDEHGNPHSWTTLGTDPKWKCVLEKVDPDDPRVKAGFTGTP
jgi:hypothetical protein